MQTLSAIDAIGPAWNHTRRLLLGRRDWRLLLKITFIAVIAQIGGCNSSFSSPGRHLPGKSTAIMAALLAFAILIGVAIFFIGLIVFYLSSRLQFVLFDVVLRSDTAIGPIWRRYGAITWRWIGLKLLFFLVAGICIAPLLVPIAIHFFHAFSDASRNGGQPADPVSFVLSILGTVLLILLIAIFFAICYLLLRDFGLPSMALENASIGVTVERVVRLVRREPGQVALYVLMHVLMRIGGAFVCYIALFFATFIALIPFGGAGVGLWLGLRHADASGHFAMVVGWVVLGGIFVVLFVIASIMLFGYLFTFFQAYTLYFLGGRYPMIATYLGPIPPPQYSYVPPPGVAQPRPVP